MNSVTPLVCNMDVFTPAQRDAHVLTTTQLFETVQSVQEADNGYEFMFPNEAQLIVKIAEFIVKERLCCPFLKFTLTINPTLELVSLLLTGPTGTQEFLKVEFAGVFQ